MLQYTRTLIKRNAAPAQEAGRISETKRFAKSNEMECAWFNVKSTNRSAVFININCFRHSKDLIRNFAVGLRLRERSADRGMEYFYVRFHFGQLQNFSQRGANSRGFCRSTRAYQTIPIRISFGTIMIYSRRKVWLHLETGVGKGVNDDRWLS